MLLGGVFLFSHLIYNVLKLFNNWVKEDETVKNVEVVEIVETVQIVQVVKQPEVRGQRSEVSRIRLMALAGQGGQSYGPSTSFLREPQGL